MAAAVGPTARAMIGLKLVASAAIIAIVDVVARRNPAFGGLLAALPIRSVRSVTWLALDGLARPCSWPSPASGAGRRWPQCRLPGVGPVHDR